jgi:hypothetical protein
MADGREQAKSEDRNDQNRQRESPRQKAIAPIRPWSIPFVNQLRSFRRARRREYPRSGR